MNKLIIICTDYNDADYAYRIIENASDEKINYFTKECENLINISHAWYDMRDMWEEYSNNFTNTWKYELKENEFEDSKFSNFNKEDVCSALRFYNEELPGGYYPEERPHSIVYIKVFDYNNVYTII